jgi:hypothetical protein
MEQEQISHSGLRLARPDVPRITMVARPASAALPTATLRILLGFVWTANAAL